MSITTGMLLAAGRGERMRPLTDTCPKPLLEISGRSMLDRALDQMEAAGLTRIVVNACYRAGQVEQALATRNGPCLFSRESEALETGGGICNALPLLGDKPFFVMNGDGVLENTDPSPFARLAAAWNSARMDALLLVLPVAKAHFFGSPGNFRLLPDGRLVHGTQEQPADMAYIGLQILHPRLFHGIAPHAFPLRELYAKAAGAGRLFGLTHTGTWLHVGTPKAYAEAPALMEHLGIP
ncbi:MAG TPA: mannose-1-phosphate guanylyltransferase [Rhodospirillaceae bacterium]|nr:MAG: hypothetical protein A2018_01730 [Alphaproteobacteria bacterium GWF2_58_20]HAU28564.1 mannose-1-phosphate guanylyltransferase [Rhodospirillaceae bacterium]